MPFLLAAGGVPAGVSFVAELSMRTLTKDWDQHVVHAEEVARTPGFQKLRDRIIEYAEPRSDDRVVDVGSGTGLLTLALAEQVDRIYAVDIAAGMTEYLGAKAQSAGYDNVETITGSAISLPLVDGAADLVVSNYCFHHLNDADKHRALSEARRVLTPGGRLVFADMMFRVAIGDPRDRDLIRTKVRSMAKKGPSGFVRLAKNGLRIATGTWEKPAKAAWWDAALRQAGFVDVEVTELEHEGGLGRGRVPA